MHLAPRFEAYSATVETDDGTLVSYYTYMACDRQFNLEVVRWMLPVFEVGLA